MNIFEPPIYNVNLISSVFAELLQLQVTESHLRLPQTDVGICQLQEYHPQGLVRTHLVLSHSPVSRLHFFLYIGIIPSRCR